MRRIAGDAPCFATHAGLTYRLRFSRNPSMPKAPPITPEQFSRILKDYRERHQLTQNEAAAKLGVSVRTLQNWEIARNMPRGFGLRALVGALECGEAIEF